MKRTGGTWSSELDAAVEEVAARRAAWAELDIEGRAALLDRMVVDTGRVASSWVEVECARKGVPVDSPAAGEEWFIGPLVTVRHLRLLRDTLTAIARRGGPDLPGVHTLADGSVAVRVFPTDAYDRLLFMGVTGETWLQPGIDVADARAAAGGLYRQGGSRPAGVGVVLGAGNTSCIPACDVLWQLFGENRVVVLKLSPLTTTLAPILESAFGALVEGGFLRIVQGGAAQAQHLVEHRLVDAVHLTGGAATYDAIVFGAGVDGAGRKARGQPRLTKPVLAELGNVTPLIVVPGPWSSRDVGYQAEHVATGVAHNAGCNCVSTRVMLTPRGWDRREDLLEALRGVLRDLPNRVGYYPGSAGALAGLVQDHPRTELLGGGPAGSLPWGLLPGLDPIEGKALCQTETFAPVLIEVALNGSSPAAFVEDAVRYCNQDISGTLGVTLAVHPASMLDPATAAAVQHAITDLRYGTVAVNIWAASAFGLVSPAWGAYPSDDPSDIQSGHGFVHNTYLLPRPRKTVMKAPWYPVPKPAWWVTHRHSLRALAAATRLNANPDPRILPGLFATALRG